MRTRTNKVIEMARMMIKQAKLLKQSGLVREARVLARRAVALNNFGHLISSGRQQPVPVRISDHRSRR